MKPSRSRMKAVLPALFLLAAPLAGQEAPGLSVGMSAGLGAVQIGRINTSWELGPVLGGRLQWGGEGAAASLDVQVQPFRVESNTPNGDFRALYLVPTLATGSRSRRIGVGAGLGMFDFDNGSVNEGLEVAFVAGLSGSARIARGYHLELGWKRVNNVRGVRANVWTLQLVRRWGSSG